MSDHPIEFRDIAEREENAAASKVTGTSTAPRDPLFNRVVTFLDRVGFKPVTHVNGPDQVNFHIRPGSRRLIRWQIANDSSFHDLWPALVIARKADEFRFRVIFGARLGLIRPCQDSQATQGANDSG